MASRSSRPSDKSPRTPSAQIDKFRDLARELEADEDEKAFEEKVKRVATATRPERVRVDFAKGGGGFTAHREGGGSIYPVYPTQEEVRDWLRSAGFAQVGDDPDIWGR